MSRSKLHSVFSRIFFGPLPPHERMVQRLAWLSFQRELLPDMHTNAYGVGDLLSIRILRTLFDFGWRVTNLPIPEPKRVAYDPNKSPSENGFWLTAGPYDPGGSFEISPRRDKPFTVYPHALTPGINYRKDMTLAEMKEYMSRYD